MLPMALATHASAASILKNVPIFPSLNEQEFAFLTARVDRGDSDFEQTER